MNKKIYKFYVPVKLNQEQSEKLDKLGDLLSLTQSKALRYLIDHADIKTIAQTEHLKTIEKFKEQYGHEPSSKETVRNQ